MINIAILKPTDARKYWNEIAPLLNLAIQESNDELRIDGILERIEAGELLLAVVFKDKKLIAAATYELTDFDSGKKVIHIQLAGGDHMDEWFEQIEEIATDLARVQGCSEVYIIGRKGWERKMKNLGYRHIHTIVSKEVH